jgi:hypothetical protein
MIDGILNFLGRIGEERTLVLVKGEGRGLAECEPNEDRGKEELCVSKIYFWMDVKIKRLWGMGRKRPQMDLKGNKPRMKGERTKSGWKDQYWWLIRRWIYGFKGNILVMDEKVADYDESLLLPISAAIMFENHADGRMDEMNDRNGHNDEQWLVEKIGKGLERGQLAIMGRGGEGRLAIRRKSRKQTTIGHDEEMDETLLFFNNFCIPIKNSGFVWKKDL